MGNQGSGWTRFWQAERHAFDDVMRLATQYFSKQFCKAFPIQGDVHVFDYGCGPEFLADELIPKGIMFSGADINQYFIDLCLKHHPQGNFFCVHADPGSNLPLLPLHLKKRADYIILLSITQYFPSPNDLEHIIVSLKPHLAIGGSIIVADVVDNNTKSYRDALSLLIHTAQKGQVGAFVRFMRYVLGSEYAKTAKSTRLQIISPTFMEEMCARQHLTCRRQPGLTLHPTRQNYILQLAR